MCNTAAHLTDRVVPGVPVRQWVLSVPYELRVLLAARADALTLVGRAFVDEVFRWKRQKLGVDHAKRGLGGAIAFHHRFGGSLNLHVHFHVCVLDGIYSRSDAQAPLNFVRTPPPAPLDRQEITLSVHLRVLRWLKRRGLIRDPDEAEDFAEARLPSALEACLLGSLGVGQLVTSNCDSDPGDGKGTIAPRGKKRGRNNRDQNGYSLHAGVVIRAHDAAGRERLFRYCSRPPLSLKRLSMTDEGQVLYEVRNPIRPGQTHRIMTPVQFLARLAALIPPPRHPLIRFHGVLGPHAAARKAVVPAGDSRPEAVETRRNEPTASAPCPQSHPRDGPRAVPSPVMEEPTEENPPTATPDTCGRHTSLPRPHSARKSVPNSSSHDPLSPGASIGPLYSSGLTTSTCSSAPAGGVCVSSTSPRTRARRPRSSSGSASPRPHLQYVELEPSTSGHRLTGDPRLLGPASPIDRPSCRDPCRVTDGYALDSLNELRNLPAVKATAIRMAAPALSRS